MNILWPQVLTQMLGFVLAVLILRKYAWGPVLTLLDARRAKIASEFERIDTTRAEVAKLRADYEAQLKNLDAQARARIQEAVQEGQKIAAEIVEKARIEAREQADRAKAEIAREHDKARVSLKNEIVEMVVSATERVVRERLDDAKQKQKIAEFIDSLSAVDTKGRGK